jgi:NAD+-dependent secondary alcohol dehydrogenase Adh1
MRAVQVVGYHQNLEMTDVPTPTPTGPFDVVVRIGGAGVCRTDLHILEGQWAEKSQVALPYTIGHENAGWVHAVGSAVTNVAEGDKVIVHPLITCGLCRACRSGDDVHCEANQFPGIDTNGGYAEYLKTSARSVVKIDDSLEPADVAALADAGLTAYHAAAKAARRMTPRDKCVIIGAGGLGHIGIQVLKALSPAELIVVDRNPEALKLAEAIGADHGVVADGTGAVGSSRERSSAVDQVLALTGGNGAESVVDFVGEGGATAQGVAMLRRAGDYYVVGYGENIDVPTIDIVSTEINFIGNLVGSYNDLCDLMALAGRGAVTLHTQKYALDDFQSAITDLDNGNVRGRAILIP